MIDTTTLQLNETLYRERLQAAAEARQRRATWVAAPSMIGRLRQAIAARRAGPQQQIPTPECRHTSAAKGIATQ